MTTALRDMLPLAVAIAVSPVPIIAVVFMLVVGEGRVNALALLGGWALALAAVSGGVALLGIAPVDDSGNGAAIVRFVLAGILLVVIAVELRNRSRAGATSRPPRILRLLEGGGAVRALGIGVVLIVLNAKDGSLTVAAGAKLGEAAPGPAAGAVCVVVFTLVSSLTMIVPILLDVAYGERARPALARAHAWLERHGSTAVLVTLAIIVVVLVVQGVKDL